MEYYKFRCLIIVINLLFQELEEESSGPPDLPTLQVANEYKREWEIFFQVLFLLKILSKELAFVLLLDIIFMCSVKADIGSYYGYNEFLNGILVQVFR